MMCALFFTFFSCAGEEQSPYVRVGGENIYFADAKKAETWRAPLEKLLSNVLVMTYVEGKRGPQYVAPDPDSPAIEDGWHFGLFDVTFDGVPELLVDLGGGSAGNACYNVYDIFTGEMIGDLNGGFDGAWCVYYNVNEKEFAVFGDYIWRMGWDGRMHFFNKLTYDGKSFCEEEYFYEFFTLDIHGYCLGVSYRINGKEDFADNYLYEKDAFERSYVRIHETGLKLFSWEDVCDEDEDRHVKGKKMTDALLGSGQRFVIYG